LQTEQLDGATLALASQVSRILTDLSEINHYLWKGLHTMGGLLRSRHEPSGESETFRRWEGRTVLGKFPLQRYLGGSDHSAVFLTTLSGVANGPIEAAIKLISAVDVDADKQLRQWNASRELAHPNLIRIFESGRCELDGTALLYVAMEYAEENLSQIIPERALTTEEARGLLPAVLQALHYAHDKGLVHGRVQPSNILASADQVKLSTDTLSPPGVRNCADSVYDSPESATGAISTASDIWQLGVTLVEVLTQRLPRFDLQQNKQATLPDGIAPPFREIVENCLRADPSKRWTITQIADRLDRLPIGRPQYDRPQPTVVAVSAPVEVSRTVAAHAPTKKASTQKENEKKRSVDWLYVIALVAGALIAIFLIVRPKSPAPTAPAITAQNESSDQSSNKSLTAPSASPSSPVGSSSPNNVAQPGSSAGSTTAASVPALGATTSDGQVLERVAPNISPGALHSVRGKIRIQVKVDVDQNGHVTDVRLKSRGPSKFFAREALEAAKSWKFDPPREKGQPIASQWMVQFNLTRRAIDDSAVRIER
jgi:serine/threonine-protein kinase